MNGLNCDQIQSIFDDMRSVKVSEDIVPIGEFKGKAARWLKRAETTGQPVVITLNGRPAGVIVSPAEYDRLQERERFLSAIAEGLADAEAGRLVTTAQARRQLGLRRARRK